MAWGKKKNLNENFSSKISNRKEEKEHDDCETGGRVPLRTKNPVKYGERGNYK